MKRIKKNQGKDAKYLTKYLKKTSINFDRQHKLTCRLLCLNTLKEKLFNPLSITIFHKLNDILR